MASAPVHPDRRALPTWLARSTAAATAVSAAVAGSVATSGPLGALAGGVVGLLAVTTMRSASIRLVARVVVAVSAAVLVRYGFTAGSISGSGQLIALWVVAVVAVLVLTDRIGTEAAPALDGDGPLVAAAAPAPVGRTVVAVALAVVAAIVVLTPLVVPHVGRDAEPGEGATLDPTQGGALALQATDSLDMTQRPELTDEVVFTVDSDAATFWRGETFDVWDGRRWTRSDDRFVPLVAPDRLQLADDDLGARGADELEQRIRMEVAFADVVFAAPSPVEIDIDRPVRQRDDGTLQSAPMGRGTTYTVTSRREPLTAERLRAVDDGDTPPEVAARWASPPVATERVRDLADEVVGDATTRYDQILAIERWIGERVEYSIDAPLSPAGTDVVDHFLFEAEQGWCEQIASSLVVLARLNGIPARLATGYVPDERDPVTGAFTVRQRNAHAWTEVWFPEVGWVPFDPTADVPLAGEDQADPTIAGWLAEHAVVLVLVLGALLALVGPVRAWARRRRGRRAARPEGWVAVTDRRLDALGATVGRERLPDETATAFAEALVERYGDPRLGDVGALLDAALYSPRPPSPAEQLVADGVLAAVEAAGPVEPVAVDAGAGAR
jgi:transglutaminase-like putative cysteine protease